MNSSIWLLLDVAVLILGIIVGYYVGKKRSKPLDSGTLYINDDEIYVGLEEEPAAIGSKEYVVFKVSRVKVNSLK